MRIFVAFPHNFHWRHKETFNLDWGCMFPIGENGRYDKHGTLFIADDVRFTLQFLSEMKNSFVGIDFWSLEKPRKDDLFASNHSIDYYLVPAEYY